MCSTILIIKADDTERELLKNMLVVESFEVMDFKNSMQAILWLKKNTPPAAVVIEEMAAPMDAHATAEYIAKDLKLSVPIGILAPVQNGKMAATETNYITGPLDANTIFQINGLMKKSVLPDIKIAKKTSFSLAYLEDIFEG
ncbi:MAG: hypothetical protein WA951_15325, partial [Leeuwenhoekiella sp.]